VLDVADDVAAARLGDNRDRIERAGEGFHASVRAAYRTLAASGGWCVVDGGRAPAAAADDVWAAVRRVL
jgi:thymidylate kinase